MFIQILFSADYDSVAEVKAADVFVQLYAMCKIVFHD